ncbi:MAG TPA: oligosaccharide flippase family protein [Blastocatellia bacterium]
MSQSILDTVADPRRVNQTSELSALSAQELTGQPFSETLRYRTALAALTSGGAELVTRILTVVLSIVTARLLEPVEVGLLGLAVIVIGVISMLGFYPETAAVAARGGRSDHQYAFAATEVRAVIIALSLALLWLTFPVVAHYLTGKEDAAIPLRQLLGVLAWMPVLELLSGYPQIVMQRRLQLNYIARLQIIQPIVFVGLAVAFLLTGRGYIGVAWASVVSAAMTAAMLWWRLLWRRGPAWEFWPSRSVRYELMSGTAKVFAGGFGGYLTTRVDNVIVSGVLGLASMSFYSMAWNASRTPVLIFNKAISFVLMPTLARIQDESIRMQRAVRECLQYSNLLLVPICAALFVSAPSLVSIVIGPKWLPMVPCLRIMCLTALLHPAVFVANALLVSRGRAHLSGIATALQLLALVVLIPVLANRWGIIGAALGDFAAVTILGVALYWTARAVAREISWNMLSTFVGPLIAATAASFVALNIAGYINPVSARLVCEISLVLVIYLLILTVVGGRGALLDLLRLLVAIARPRTVATGSQA